jgi:hypothetical protein
MAARTIIRAIPQQPARAALAPLGEGDLLWAGRGGHAPMTAPTMAALKPLRVGPGPPSLSLALNMNELDQVNGDSGECHDRAHHFPIVRRCVRDDFGNWCRLLVYVVTSSGNSLNVSIELQVSKRHFFAVSPSSKSPSGKLGFMTRHLQRRAA